MEKMTINFTQSDVEDMMCQEEGHVFTWTFETDQGTEVEVEITVGPDEE